MPTGIYYTLAQKQTNLLQNINNASSIQQNVYSILFSILSFFFKFVYLGISALN